MKKGWRKFSILFLALFLTILTACNDTEEKASDVSEEEHQKTIAKIESENVKTEGAGKKDGTDNEDQEATEEVTFEINNGPDDQGDMNVWFKGDFEITGNKIIVKGTTNLLPDSRIQLYTDAVNGTIIGGDDQAIVEESGSFELEGGFPDDYEGALHLELSFRVGAQSSEEVKKYYSDGLTGDFAEIYYDGSDEKILKKASFNKTVIIDGSNHSFSITKPEWDIPEDIGSTNVRLEPTIEKVEDFLVVKFESNIIEEATVQAQASIPNYITTGFQGSTTVNPDGTGVIYLADPEKDDRIKNLTDYEINIMMDPTNSQNEMSTYMIEVYGEKGKNLQGEYVVEDEGEKAIEQHLKITVD
ncbi:hypothetical protein [Aquibacillus rhizosphaerae]|uniref:Uncharacterized protein n=1 Tax=Aquibacillus rhizosphaerae TaxID=3051431 RepID=A0ABT7L1W4_9BACI|nr:hypothetical protein [Aquibacillus sp. LR5S19]MDL4839819.1 hypothetical protein [Aquibacillus sp. LR5S19]